MADCSLTSPQGATAAWILGPMILGRSRSDDTAVSLVELAIDDLRCIERAELELHPGQNLIWGGNGSGKTSLLEAMFLLGRGRSFRTRNSERLIRYGRDRLVVFGRTGGGNLGGPSDPEVSDGGVGRLALPGADLGELDRGLADPASRAMGHGQGWPDSSGVGRSSPMTEAEVRAEPERPWIDVAGAEFARAVQGSDGGSVGRRSFGPQGVGQRSAYPHALGSEAVQVGGSVFTGRGAVGQPLGVQVSRADGTTARISGTNAKSLTELTQVFPVQIIDPGVHKLVEEGGHRRRRWMDWAVFHVEHQFGDWWLRYTRALKQRNAALRAQPDQARIWDSELVRLGELIAAARGRFMEELLPYWRESVAALSGLEPELHYFKGWAQDVSLAEALVASRVRDETKRITHPGPHRADVLIRLKGRPAREVLSRGQQKLVAVAMTLAQLHLVQSATQTTPTLLLDDPAAELDGAHLRRFIDQVLRLRSQLVLTSLHPDSQLFGKPDCVFHVEQGRVQPV